MIFQFSVKNIIITCNYSALPIIFCVNIMQSVMFSATQEVTCGNSHTFSSQLSDYVFKLSCELLSAVGVSGVFREQ